MDARQVPLREQPPGDPALVRHDHQAESPAPEERQGPGGAWQERELRGLGDESPLPDEHAVPVQEDGGGRRHGASRGMASRFAVSSTVQTPYSSSKHR